MISLYVRSGVRSRLRPLFDHLVGAQQKRLGDDQSERLGTTAQEESRSGRAHGARGQDAFVSRKQTGLRSMPTQAEALSERTIAARAGAVFSIGPKSASTVETFFYWP
jgi:hypothetical protein